MDQPLVSIGLVTYMHEQYIKDCLESLIAQTYQNIELLILDDASSDATYDIILSYESRMQERFPYLSIVKNSQNTGNVSANLNKILQKAKGAYIKTFAGDDAMLPAYVEEVIAFLEKSENDDAILVYTNAYVVDDDFHLGDEPGKNCFYRRHKPYQQKDVYGELLRQNYIVAPAVMMRRRVYEQYGFYDEKIPLEDYDLWLRLSRRERFVYLPSKLIYYRKADTSLTNYMSGDGREKVKFIFTGSKATVQKNLKGLPKEKRRIYQRNFFQFYMVMSYQYGFWDIAVQILVFMWRKGYHVDMEVYRDMWKAVRFSCRDFCAEIIKRINNKRVEV